MSWDADTVRSIGRSRELHFADYLRRGAKAKTDKQRKQRVAVRECRFCFYVSRGMAGQAFTKYDCMACGTPCVHSNTAVPKLCESCADELGACVRCGGLREWPKPEKGR